MSQTAEKSIIKPCQMTFPQLVAALGQMPYPLRTTEIEGIRVMRLTELAFRVYLNGQWSVKLARADAASAIRLREVVE